MKRLITLISLALVMGSFAPAHADGTEIVAGAADPYTGSYATPLSVTPVGGPLTLGNLDVEARGLESDQIGPDKNSWCSLGHYPKGACPLFWARSIDVAYHTSPVLGLNQLVPGQTYTFHDSLHPNIKGTLIAV